MLRKIVWCYILVLSLVDITVKTKLSAHGKSHDASANGHDTLSEAYSFTEEWMDGTSLQPSTDKIHQTFASNKDASELLIQLDPPTLCLQQTYLGEAVRSTVTLTNVGQDTLHLASLAGNTPDFHASFFEHKMVPAGANTSFSIVYIGRQVGQSSGTVYVQTSRGVLRYNVLSETWPPMWGLWPVELNVPFNATVRADLVVTNPSSHSVQVTQIYSSSSWLGLELLDGTSTTSREQWTIPAGATKTIARLAPSLHSSGVGAVHSAWVRVRRQHMPRIALLAVTGRQVPAGMYVQPEQVRIRAAGTHDPPAQTTLHVGNSSPAPLTIHHVTVTSRCSPLPHHPHNNTAAATSAPGVSVQLLKSVIDPHSLPQPAVKVTFNYAAMWSAYYVEHKGSSHHEWDKQAFCAGVITVEGTALPYSVTLLVGGAAIAPRHIHVVRESSDASRPRELRVRNEMPQPILRLIQLEPGPSLDRYFHIKDLTGGVLRVGGEVSFAELTVKSDAPHDALDSWIALHTNVSRYVASVATFSGRLKVSWEWPVWEDEGPLSLGTLPVSSTKRVRGTLTSPAPRPLCVTELATQLPGASLTLTACAQLTRLPSGHACMCVEPYGKAAIVLTMVAPARPGTIHGSITIATQHANTTIPVTLTASEGRVRARSLRFMNAAPYVHSEASLVLESTLKSPMQVIQVSQPSHRRDSNVIYKGSHSGKELGRMVVVYETERGCEPHCYTGLAPLTAPGREWVQRAANAVTDPIGVITEDIILLEQRYKLFKPEPKNVTLYVQTTEVISIPCHGTVIPYWPRLTAGAAPPPPATASIGARSAIVVGVSNPSSSHCMLLQPIVAARQEHSNVSSPPVSSWCESKRCVSRPGAFRFTTWHGEGVSEHAGGVAGAPLLLLQPGASVQLTILFNPQEESAMTATLYLRNNLTVVEPVPLDGQGCVPKLQLSPHSGLIFEVLECLRAVTQRVVTARNTGAVPLSLQGWSISGQPCRGRGFAVEPCGPLVLQPNASTPLTLSFAADYSLATVSANLTVKTGDSLEMWFPLTARIPSTVLSHCNKTPPRPPWEPPLRNAGTMIAAAAVALVLAAGALDADRLMRTSHARGGPRPPLDLRAVAAERVSPPPAATRPAPPPPLRRKRRKHDAVAEGRAFDTWRASLHDHTTDRSSSSASAPPSPPVYESLESRESSGEPDDDSTTSSELSSAPADHDQDHDNGDQHHDSLNTSDEGPTNQPQSDSHTIRPESPPPAYSTVADSPTRRRRDRRLKDDRPPRQARRTRPSQPKRRAPTAVHTAPSVTPPIVSETSSFGSNTSARYTSWSSVVVGGSAAPSRAPPPPPELRPLSRPRAHDSLFYFNGAQNQYSWPDCQTLTYDTVSQSLPYDNGHSSYEASGQSLPYENVSVQSQGKNSPYENLSGQTPTYESVTRHSPYDSVSVKPSPTKSTGTVTPDLRPFAARTEHPEEPCIKTPIPINPVGAAKASVGAVRQPANNAHLATGNVTTMGNSNNNVANMGNLGTNVATIGNLGTNVSPMSNLNNNVGNMGNLTTSVGNLCTVGNGTNVPTMGNLNLTNTSVGNLGTLGNVTNVPTMGNLNLTNTSAGNLGNLGNVSNVGTMGTNVSNVNLNLTNTNVGHLNSGGNIGAIGSGNFSSWGGLEARAPGAGWGYMRPPPGFAPSVYSPPTPQAQVPPARPFDPFQSLAAIWTRSALDWGAEDVDDQQQ